MYGGGSAYLILDACVLIDYVEVDASVLRAMATHLAPLAVARPLLDKVDTLDEYEAVTLGLDVVDPDTDVAMAAGRSGKSLSFEDWTCLLLATRNGWTCVANDGPLRDRCKAEGVAVLCGLDLLLRAVDTSAVGRHEATQMARAIHEANPYFVTRRVLHAFLRKVRDR